MAGRKDAYGIVYDTLDSTGLQWEKVNGKKHVKLYLAGHFVGILPHGKPSSSTGAVRNSKNLISRINNAAAAIKAGEQPR